MVAAVGFDLCGWVGEASFGDEGLAHGSVPTAIFCCNGFVLQRLFFSNGYFLATATFGGGDLFATGRAHSLLSEGQS